MSKGYYNGIIKMYRLYKITNILNTVNFRETQDFQRRLHTQKKTK